MCLVLRRHKTTGKLLPFNVKKLTKHPKFKNTFIVYKILQEVYTNCYSLRTKLVSLYYPGAPWVLRKEKKSNRKQRELTKTEKCEKLIDKGIHVYIKLPKSTKSTTEYNVSNRRIVKCSAKLKDFVANNEKEAVFMSVTPIKIIN